MQYFIKLSIAIAVVYLFYALFLRRLTFYTWNRWYLLVYSALAFLIPFIDVESLLAHDTIRESTVIHYIPVLENFKVGQHPEPDSFWSDQLPAIFLTMLAAGSVFMLLKSGIQYLSLRKIRSNATLLMNEGVRLYHVDQPIIPFSFGRSIFLNQSMHTEAELKEIIRHEFIHVKQRHSFDMIWSEWLCILNWYNPFAWLIRKAIRQNLEFIADHQVLQSGLDRKQYQYILLKVTGITSFSIATNFNFSSLKKRIAMMNKTKSAKVHLVRFLFMLPVLAIVLLAFRGVVQSQVTAQQPVQVQAPAAPAPARVVIVDTVPAPPPPPAKSMPASVKSIHILDNKVTVGLKNGKKENYNLDLPADKKAFEKKYGEIPGAPAPPGAPVGEVIIDMVAPAEPPKPPKPPKKVTVGVAATAPEVVDVVVQVTAPEPAAADTVPSLFHFRIQPGTPAPLVIVDGKEQQGNDVLKKISPSDVKKIEILKDASAVKLYGEKGKNGVIIVTTINAKEPDAESALREIIVMGKPRIIEQRKADANFFAEFPGLIMVDGVEYDNKTVKKLNLKPENIMSMDVLKDDATQKYGEKAKKGVILITTKKN